MSSTNVRGASLDFGRVFSRTFGVIGRNWVALAVVSILFGVVPSILIDRAHVWLALPYTAANLVLTSGAGIIAKLVPFSLVYAAVSFIVFQDLERGRADLGSALASAISAFPRVFATYVLYTLGILAGVLLLVVPGIVLTLTWEGAIPASTLERGVIRALARSQELTRTHRGEIFGIIMAYGIPIAVIGFVATLVFKKIGFPIAAYDWPMVGFRAALGFFTKPFGAVVTAVIYFELRRLREGVLHGELAEVFA